MQKKVKARAQWVALIVAIGLFLLTPLLLQPQFGTVELQRSDIQETLEAGMPVQFYSDAIRADITIPMYVSALQPATYHITPDDCLHALHINGQLVDSIEYPQCDYAQGITVDLSSYLYTGQNVITATIENVGGAGGLSMQVAHQNLITSMPMILLAIAIAWLLFSVMQQFSSAIRIRWLYCIILAGIGIRLLYVLATPYNVRAHDVDGHIEYVRFLMEHWALPTEGTGWQWYQPPLYYISLMPIISLFDMSDVVYKILQYPTVLSSLLLVGLMAWMATLLFPKGKCHTFLALVVSYPALIYASARINNDAYVLLFGGATLAYLLAWWKKGGVRMWYGAVICLGLGLLSKGNALLFVPILVVSLLCKKGMSRQQKMQHASISALVLTTMTSWLFALRFFAHTQPAFVGNIGSMHSGLLLKNTFAHLTQFRLWSVVSQTYNNVWEDVFGRQYFWEYLYRSGLFGEFSFPDALQWMATAMAVLGLIILGAGLYGWIYSFLHRWYDDLPLLLTMVIILLGHLAFRIEFPYSSSQDMRYSALIIIPIAYFAVQTVQVAPRNLATILRIVIFMFSAISILFLARVSIF